MTYKFTNRAQKAIEIAKQARGRTSPNPMSGAVVVKDDEIVVINILILEKH